MTTDAKPEPANKPAAMPRAKRRWYQFSLRAMFVWVTVIGVGLASWQHWIAPAQQQQVAVRMIERAGGSFQYADPPTDESWPTSWLREWLPRDYFDEVELVSLGKSSVTDADLRVVGRLTNLRLLSLDNTQVGDNGLAHLSGLTQLHTLSL